MEVVHDRPWSRVLRISTAEDDLYLKQCAPVQAFEVPLTVALAARWPDRMPEVVAADVERAWLLLRDGGTRLREGGEPDTFARALELYGELQRDEAAHVDELLALGLPDVRLPVVAAAYERSSSTTTGSSRTRSPGCAPSRRATASSARSSRR